MGVLFHSRYVTSYAYGRYGYRLPKGDLKRVRTWRWMFSNEAFTDMKQQGLVVMLLLRLVI